MQELRSKSYVGVKGGVGFDDVLDLEDSFFSSFQTEKICFSFVFRSSGPNLMFFCSFFL